MSATMAGTFDISKLEEALSRHNRAVSEHTLISGQLRGIFIAVRGLADDLHLGNFAPPSVNETPQFARQLMAALPKDKQHIAGALADFIQTFEDHFSRLAPLLDTVRQTKGELELQIEAARSDATQRLQARRDALERTIDGALRPHVRDKGTRKDMIAKCDEVLAIDAQLHAGFGTVDPVATAERLIRFHRRQPES